MTKIIKKKCTCTYQDLIKMGFKEGQILHAKNCPKYYKLKKNYEKNQMEKNK